MKGTAAMKTKMRRAVFIGASAMAVAATCMAAKTPAARPAPAALPEARLAEIAAALPELPRADGAPARDRAKWAPLAATKEGQAAIRNAEKIGAEPVPDTPDELYLEFSRNGNRSNYQKCFFRRKANFAWLYVGECLERRGRFIPKIVEYMDAFCAMKSWTLPAHDGKLTCFNGTPHVDLSSSELSRELAYCLSWRGDAIPAMTRENVFSEISRGSATPSRRQRARRCIRRSTDARSSRTSPMRGVYAKCASTGGSTAATTGTACATAAWCAPRWR